MIKLFFGYFESVVIIIALKYSASSFNDCIQKIPQGFNYLKTYTIKDESKTNEFSYVLTSGTTYSILVCCEKHAEKIIVMDYNRNKLVEIPNHLTNLPIEYHCKATGIYYINIVSNYTNGELILSFKR